MKPSFWSAILIIFALMLPAQAFAKSTISVTCVDQSGKALSGVKVDLWHLDSNKWRDKKSDAKGLARFDGLDDGGYRIVARLNGFEPSLYEFIVVKGNAQESASVTLQPGPSDKKLYYEDETVRKQAMDAFMEGVQALQAQKYAEAENKIRVSLQMNPTNPDGHLNLAIACIQQNKWDGAEASLKEAVRISGAMAELQRTRNPEAAASLDQLHQRSSGLLQQVPILKVRAAASVDLANKNFDAAIAKYQEILKNFPEDSDTYYNLALAQANAQRYPEAVQAIDKALQLRPNEADFVKLRQQIGDHQENFRLKQARVILEEADKLAQAGKSAEALSKYEEARPLLSEKNQAVVFAAMGSAHAKLNQPTEAAADYKRAIELAPENANYKKLAAQFYVSQKQYEEALKLYTDAAAAGSAPPDQALIALAKQMAQQGNNEVAELAYEKALQVNPQNADACYELGMSFYFAKKNTDRAKELLTKYLEIGKDQSKLSTVKDVLVVMEKRKP